MPYLGRGPDFGVRSVFHFLATNGQTSVSGADADGKSLSFTDGLYIDVYLNGVRLKSGEDYNTSTANTVAGLSALNANDEVNIVVYDTFTVADTVKASEGGTFSGGVTVTGDLAVGDDVSLTSDSAVLSFGAGSDTTLTHTDGSGLTLNSTNKLMFRDSALSVSSSADGQLDIDADTEVEITATTVDINGDVEISGTTTQTGVSTSAAKDVFNAGLSVKNGSSSAGFIEFFEDSDNGTNKVTLIGPASSGDVTLTLPAVTDTVAAVGDITALAIALG